MAPPTSSFPSGHTFASVVLWGALAIVAYRSHWSTWWRRLFLALVFVLPLLVAFSRVYRGMHHLTDVLASFTLAAIWLVVLDARSDADRSGSMSTAQLVPETWELDGDDAAQTLRQNARFGPLLIDSVRRFRVADGFSHAGSLAFAMVLTVIPGVIALVGLATVAGAGAFRHTVEELAPTSAPGRVASSHGCDKAGRPSPAQHGIVPLVFGTWSAMLISGVTCFGQVERSANRIYGIEQDRPFSRSTVERRRCS